jgi:hypothetical protein
VRHRAATSCGGFASVRAGVSMSSRCKPRTVPSWALTVQYICQVVKAGSCRHGMEGGLRTRPASQNFGVHPSAFKSGLPQLNSTCKRQTAYCIPILAHTCPDHRPAPLPSRQHRSVAATQGRLGTETPKFVWLEIDARLRHGSIRPRRDRGVEQPGKVDHLACRTNRIDSWGTRWRGG